MPVSAKIELSHVRFICFLAWTAELFMVQCLFCDTGAFAIWLRTAMAEFKVVLFFAGAILHNDCAVLYTNSGKLRKIHRACAVRIMRLCIYIARTFHCLISRQTPDFPLLWLDLPDDTRQFRRLAAARPTPFPPLHPSNCAQQGTSFYKISSHGHL